MEEILKTKEVSKEQSKEISRIVFKSKLRMFWITMKFVSGLFLANMCTVIITHVFLSSASPEGQNGFKFISVILNTIFMGRYFHLRVKDSRDMLIGSIKEVLKNNEQ